MTGFEPRTSGIGSNRSTNWATTTAGQVVYPQKSRPRFHLMRSLEFLLTFAHLDHDQCDRIWQKFALGSVLEGLFGIWQNFDHTLPNLT